jgi:FkbH-like protein
MSIQVSFSEMQKHLKKGDKNKIQAQQFNLTILRNITLEPIEVPLKYFAQQSNLKADITFGVLDNIFQDSGDSTKITPNTDAVLIVCPLIALLPQVHDSFASLSKKEKEKEYEYFHNFATSVLERIKESNKSTAIFWLNFEMPCDPSFGINDINLENGQSQFVTKLNQCLGTLLAQYDNGYIIESDAILRKLGADQFYDLRYWHIARAPYSRNALINIGQQFQTHMNILMGKNKKCLILDCDGTLWGGIVGEDGIDGIGLSLNYPGVTFKTFQTAIVDLYSQGVIIALCSKNNEQDVIDVFEQHPDMQLKLDHIAAKRINWNDKVQNIKEIAEELNIGLSSMVFIDDNPFEIEWVEDQLPEVQTMLLKKGQEIQYARQIKALNCFDKQSITSEDFLKGQMYQSQKQRNALKQKKTGIDDFLNNLDMSIYVKLADSQNVARVAQQTQKTNQFNLTTKRYSEDQIQKFINSNNYTVFVLNLEDRFGDMGFVGSAILDFSQPKKAQIDTFLLSCRVLGRQVEMFFLEHLLSFCQNMGHKIVNGIFIPSDKNQQTADFYKNNNFIAQSSTHKNEEIWQINIENFKPTVWNVFKIRS